MAIVVVLALFLIVLTGCSIFDSALGGGPKGGDGWLPRLVEPLQGVPGPLGLGALAISGLAHLWQLARGKRWKSLATDSVSLFDKLKADPEGKKLWDLKIKPRLDSAKGRKDIVEIKMIIKEVEAWLKEQKDAVV